jgi:hypothetical protein
VAPAEGVTLEDKRAVNAALLASGAPIGAMNTGAQASEPGEGRAARRGGLAGADAGAADLGRAGETIRR